MYISSQLLLFAQKSARIGLAFERALFLFVEN